MATKVISVPGETADGSPGQARLRTKITTRGRLIIALAGEGAADTLRKIPKGTPEGSSSRTLGLTGEDIRSLQTLNDAYILAYLKAWNLVDEDTGEPLPIPTEDTIGDVEADLANIIAREAAILWRKQKEAQGEFGPDGFPDKDSPTGASSDSNGDEKEAKAMSIPSLPIDIEATNTDASSLL